MNYSHPLKVGNSLDAATFSHLAREMMLEHCKWDPQVGDTPTLLPFPLYLDVAAWQHIAESAERLTVELLAMERELQQRPELHEGLGLPWPLRSALERAGETPDSIRVMRFDFHWTYDGWRVSEVNSDVPGGYCESTAFTRRMATLCGGRATGMPGDVVADRIVALAQGRPVALASAVGFMEDHQVVSYVAQSVRALGGDARIVSLDSLAWHCGRASLAGEALGLLFRFVQAEWLPKVAPSTWQNMFAGCVTPMVNPVQSVLSESKRLPVLWSQLAAQPFIWRDVLPTTRDPRDAELHTEQNWVLKAAFSNTGDHVVLKDSHDARVWIAAVRRALRDPLQWAAQKRFSTVPVETRLGYLYPCVGVYTVDGKACGIYGRASRAQTTRFDAHDVAVLLSSTVGESA